MATFYLLDQSLEGIGGHHYDYARCMVAAATRLGWNAVVGANRRFRPDREFAHAAKIISAFRNSTYSKFSYLAGLNGLTRNELQELWPNSQPSPQETWTQRFMARWTLHSFHKHRQAHIRQFACDCELFFRDRVFDDGDHVLMAGVSELELMGLAAYLSNHPRTLQVQWHLLFHFNVFDGRPADYQAQQTRAILLQRCFDAAMARIPYHQVTFYTTTDALADQYNRLSRSRFDTLPYPVNQTFWESPQTLAQVHDGLTGEAAGPLTLTYAGAVRREKGQRQVIQSLVDELWPDLLSNAKLRLQIQRAKKRFGRKPKLDIEMPDHQPRAIEPICYVDHPLPIDDYTRLIKSTDIGLLAYDPRAYFGRRAGILGEYLCAGRPVIVPAGSWLAEQIALHTQDYITEQLQRQRVAFDADLADMQCAPGNVPQHGGIVAFDYSRRPFMATIPIQQPVDALSFEFRWHWPMIAGSFCRIELSQFDDCGRMLDQQMDVLGIAHSNVAIRSLVSIRGQTQQIVVRITNAFDECSLSVRDLRAIGLAANGQTLPRSAVGIVAASNEWLPAAVREIVEHYDHYRQTAIQWSLKFREAHLPERTFAELIAKKGPPTSLRRSA